MGPTRPSRLVSHIHPRILPALQTLYAECTRRGLTPAPLAVVSPIPLKSGSMVAKAATTK